MADRYNLAALHDLRDRLAKATGPDRSIDEDLRWHLINMPGGHCREHDGVRQVDVSHGHDDWRPIGPYFFGSMPGLTRSIDACVALIERVMPEANCHGYSKSPNGIDAFVSRNYVEDRKDAWLIEANDAPTIPLALLRAMIDALIAKEERADG